MATANFFDQFDAPAQPGGNFFDRFDPGYVEPEGPGDFTRGAKIALGQTPAILKGVVGLAGATAEKAVGEGGIATGVKNWGLQGFTEGMQKLQPLQRDTDELTTAWARAKEGDLGALVDWAQYGLGYAAGQGGEAVAVALLGGAAGVAAAPAAAPVSGPGGAITGLVAKGAVKDAATSLIRKAVTKEANALMAANAGKLTAEQAVQQATKTIAKEIGSTSALLAFGGAQELGSIYPEAEAEALRKGEQLSGGDLARVWASGLAAGGLEGLTDKLGISALTGKVQIPGIGSRAGNALALGAGGALTEGLTEAGQTAIERFGAGQEVASAEGQREIINAAGLGALGGGAIGAGIGAVRGPERARANAAFQDIASAETADEAIAAFEQTYVPPVLPEGLDAEGALSRMEAQMKRDQQGMRDFSETRPSMIRPVAGLPKEPDPLAEPTAQIIPDEPFGDRLITIREHLADSRTRQQIREVLGPEALNDALYYAQAADNPRLPGITSDRMLQLAERIVSQAVLQPIPDRAAQPLLQQPAPAAAPGPVVTPIATPPQSVIEVGPDGTATPVTRAGVMVDEGRVVPPEPAPAVAPLALPEPVPYRLPTPKEEKDAAFARAERDAANAAASQADAIPALAQQQSARTAAVERAGTLEGPSAMQQALARAKAIRAEADKAATSPTNDLPEPSDAQKEAGNYKKGHVRISGLDVSIENPKGSERRSKADAAQPWKVTMPAHYGYIRGTKGADGDHVDLFIGDRGDNGRFWVVNQIQPDSSRFDEHKVVTGVDSAEEAVALYKASFADNFGDKVFGSISPEMTSLALRARLPKMAQPVPVGSMPPRGTLRERVELAKRQAAPAVSSVPAPSAPAAPSPVTAAVSPVVAAAPSPVPSPAPSPSTGKAPAPPASSTTGERDEQGQGQEALLKREAGEETGEFTPAAPSPAPARAPAPPAPTTKPRLSNEAAFRNNYAALEGLTLERPVRVDGKTGVLRMDAAKAMRKIDARLDALKQLRKCLEGGS